jgi:diguanylate cyclase (GGDEF)-like protein/PAS domain S-box-containing protein
LAKPDGRFDGIVTASIDPDFAQQFWRSLDLGLQSNVSIRGLDGELRASYGFRTPPTKTTPVMAANRAAAPEGYFWGQGAADGVRRLVTYRQMQDYPLVITVGEAEDHIFASYMAHRNVYLGVAVILSILSTLFVAGIWHRQKAVERANRENERSNQRLEAALSNMPQGLSMFDADDRLVAFNRQYLDVYGLAPEKTRVGMTFKEIFTDQNAVADLDQYLIDLKRRVVALGHTNNTVTFPDGRIIYISYARGADGGWVATHEDITQRRSVEQKIEQLAHFDGLTNLANRNLFKERLEETLVRYRRLQTKFAVMLLDLDKFKAVNDALGHQAGDTLLTEVANRIRATIREVDVPARLGGDEFAVIVLPGQEDHLAEGVTTLADRVIKAISAPYEIDGHPVAVGCSIGIALVPEHGERLDEILRNADLALYKSKASGRNCATVYSPTLKTEADQRNVLEIELREAIWREEIEVFYQPIVELATGRVRSVEALARWHHKTRGDISPAEFIPLAEDTGLIVELGDLVLIRACCDATQMPRDVKVAVNLSAVQFAKSNIVDSAIYALVDSGLQEGRLVLEITESVLLSDSDQNIKALKQLKNLGITIALDDFGVGYSSLSYLTAFSFDKVKIDKSFIDRLNRPETVAVVSSIVQLGRSLNLEIVAEGLENSEQVEQVRALGIALGQGYFVGKAGPLEDLKFEPRAPTQEREVA